MDLTLGLTGTAPAARVEGDGRLNDGVGLMDYPKGRVRGRILRLGRDGPGFIVETRGSIGLNDYSLLMVQEIGARARPNQDKVLDPKR